MRMMTTTTKTGVEEWSSGYNKNNILLTFIIYHIIENGYRKVKRFDQQS